LSGDTTEQAGTGTGSDDNSTLTQVSESDVAGTPAEVIGNSPMTCDLLPSLPTDASQIPPLLLGQPKPDLEVESTLQASSCDESAGYVSCSSSILADDTPDDLQLMEDKMSDFVHPAKREMSAATKYRLRCHCGAKNCRQYLY